MKKDGWLNCQEVQGIVQKGDVLLIQGLWNMGVYIYRGKLYSDEKELVWDMYCVIGIGSYKHVGKFLHFYCSRGDRAYKFL